MKKFTVTGALVMLHNGLIALDERQARDCRSGLKATDKPGVFEIVGPVGLKKGETFGYDGDPGKKALHVIEDAAVVAATLKGGPVAGAAVATGIKLLELAAEHKMSIPEMVATLKEKLGLKVPNKGAHELDAETASAARAALAPKAPPPANPDAAPEPPADAGKGDKKPAAGSDKKPAEPASGDDAPGGEDDPLEPALPSA